MNDLLENAASVLARPSPMKIWEWVEKNLVITPRQPSPIHGKINTGITPWIRGWMDAYQDPSVENITIEKGAQTGATMTALCIACYRICEDAGPTMYVMDSEDNAKSVSETRLQPLIEDSPRCAKELPECKDDYKKLEYRLKKCTFRWVGANSAGKLASRPIRDLFLDEVEKYKQTLGNEGSVVALAEQRTKTFWNRKIWRCSSPTTTEGYIHLAYLAGDMRRFFVPCPKCKHEQYLEWDQVKFDSKLEPQEAGQTARYECKACKTLWTNSQKNHAVQHGVWKPTAKAKMRGHVSFHISSLYGPWDSCSLEWLASKFLSVKDNPSELQDFINSDLGEAWQEKRITVDTSEVDNRIGPYRRGESFADILPMCDKYKGFKTIRFMTVDVQKFGFWWVVRQWVEGGDSGLVDFGYVHTWQDLEATAQKYNIPHVLIDSGYGERTNEVYEACIQYQYIPCKGMSGTSIMAWTVTPVNIHEGKRRQVMGESISLIQHDTNNLKLQLQDRIRGVSDMAWYVFEGVGQEYARQVTSEEFVNQEWQMRRGFRDNHLFDCEELQLLAATMYGYNTRIYQRE
jgi:transposase-like protein